MSRQYGALFCRIWSSDNEFRTLSSSAQRAFMMLISQENLSNCGVLPITIGRWADLAPDTTRASIRKALKVLEDAGYVATDDTTEELLLVSFIRWDKPFANVWRRKGMYAAIRVIASPSLREIVNQELESLGQPETEEEAACQAS